MENVKAAADGTRSLMTTTLPNRHAASPRSTTAWMAPLPRLTPPDAPSSLPVAAVAMTPSPANPTAILDELVDTIDGVRAAMLASVDGFGLARSSTMSDEAAHPAMLAAAIGLARQLVSLGGGNLLRQLVVDHDGGLMLVWPLGDERVLAVMATATVDQRRVRSFVKARATWLTGIAE